MNPLWIVLGIAAVYAVGLVFLIWALWDLVSVWRWAIGTMFES
jgi:hypothetical protein